MACRRAGGLARRGTVSSCISYVTRVRRNAAIIDWQPGLGANLQQQQQPFLKSGQRGFTSSGLYGNTRIAPSWWSRPMLNQVSASSCKTIGGLQFTRGYSSDLPPHQEIGMPSLSPTMTQGNIASWKKKEGDQVAAGDVLCEIETDKATLEMESMEEGYLAKIIVGDGTKDIQVGQAICIMVESKDDISKFSNYEGAAGDAPPASAPKQEAPPPPPPKTESTPRPPPPKPAASEASPPQPSSGSRIFASPAAKKLAAERNVPLSSIRGTGPNGHILKADIEDYLASGASPAKQESSVSAAQRTPAVQGGSDYLDVPNDMARKDTAYRLLQSKQTIPHYYLSLDTRVDKILVLLDELNQFQGAAKLKPVSIGDFVIKAAALATRKVPECNSSWTDDFTRQYHNVNIGVAVQSQKELMVPVVKDADRKGLATISEEVQSLTDKATANSLELSELQGGTFTVTNLGTVGIKQFSAIVMPPQSCILAMGTTEKRVIPGPEKGEFVDGTFMMVTLSCDHRVVDGAIGAQWLGAFKGYMEEPMTLLL
ncbi:unnamed protein product [Calypogeia fissa]